MQAVYFDRKWSVTVNCDAMQVVCDGCIVTYVFSGGGNGSMLV